MTTRRLNRGPHTVWNTSVGFQIMLLEGENFHSIVHTFRGVCVKSGAPLTEVRLAWDDDILGDYDLNRKGKGGWTHQVRRHSDGTYCLGDLGKPEDMVRDCHSQAKCPKCNSYNTLVTTQEAWLDRTVCTAKRAPGNHYKDCDYEHTYMIGD